MSTAKHARSPLSFEIKSTNLPLVALHLKSADLSVLSQDFSRRFGEMPDFFDDDGIVIDLSYLQSHNIVTSASGLDTALEFSALTAVLRQHRLRPLAIRGGSTKQVAAAIAAGLIHAPDMASPRTQAPVQTADPLRQVPRTMPPPQASALVIDKPLRCGQQVYARGRDLVVMATVNAGAEVISDGHIHVYAPLRGRAIAGANGNFDARVFALSMASEMIGIAGVYDTGDHPVHEMVCGRAAQVSLASGPGGDRLVVDFIHG